MSVHRVENGWETRWRVAGRGSPQRSRQFPRKKDADAFDAEVKRRKRTGDVSDLDAGAITVADFAQEEWWRVHVEPNLAHSTKEHYAYVWDRHVLPRLGDYQLRQVKTSTVQSFQADLGADAVGDAAITKARTILSSVFALAVRQDRISSNPVTLVKGPRQRRRREVRPLSPEKVEAIRAVLSHRDATILSVLAYAGLRPGEGLVLTPEHIRGKTLLVEGSNSIEGTTKTGRNRTVRLLRPLAQDLAEWRLASGSPDEDAPLFPNRTGGFWSPNSYKNWQRRVFKPAAKQCGLERVRPYDLRHSFVSLLIHEGNSIPEVARQAGNSVETCLSVYAHVFEEFDPSDRTPAEERIRIARNSGVRYVFGTETKEIL